jgi:hypothetical protein
MKAMSKSVQVVIAFVIGLTVIVFLTGIVGNVFGEGGQASENIQNKGNNYAGCLGQIIENDGENDCRLFSQGESDGDGSDGG